MNIQKNCHTHTHRCKHATQDVSQYCAAAIEQGLTVLGISDDTALPDNFPKEGEWLGSYGGTDNKAALQAYADYFIKLMESGLFAFMAHPDLFGNSYPTWDENTIHASRDMLAADIGIRCGLKFADFGYL